MNFTLILFLSLLAGFIAWGTPRHLYRIPPWGIKAFWIVAMCVLFIFTQMGQKAMFTGAGFIGGMMLFESQYPKIRKKMADIKRKLNKGETPAQKASHRKPKSTKKAP